MNSTLEGKPGKIQHSAGEPLLPGYSKRFSCNTDSPILGLGPGAVHPPQAHAHRMGTRQLGLFASPERRVRWLNRK
jgi:hypothetical protein